MLLPLPTHPSYRLTLVKTDYSHPSYQLTLVKTDYSHPSYQLTLVRKVFVKKCWQAAFFYSSQL